MDLVITHITDIHIKQESDLEILLKRTNSIVGAIAEVIRKEKETLLLICVTGDIAFSGTKEQYEMAEKFFDDIYCKISERYEKLDVYFSFVPGNHDCDFEDKGNKVREMLIKSKELDLSDFRTMENCTSIQKNYFNFVKYYSDKKLTSLNNENSIFTEDTVINKQLGEYNIRIHCLNTAWCSFIKETKQMMFNVPKEIVKKGNNDIVITLMHHGDNWFSWAGSENWDKYHKEYSDIVLVGHDHRFQFVHMTNYNDASNYFIRGNQLYSTEEPEQSGFNIFKVNLQDNIEFFYTYAWNGKVYERIINSAAQSFERNRFSKSNISLVKELKEYLEDIEIDILNKHKSPLLLSDIYVFPSLKEDGIDNPNKVKTYREQKSILEVIQIKKKILINGNKEYGKTSLLKKLFAIYYSMDLFPIFIKVEDICSSLEDKINTLIRDSYKMSYCNLNVDEVMQMKKDKRICFIDDFDQTKLSDKSQKIFLEYINNQFDIVILTSNDKNSIVDTVKNLETNEYINEIFYELEIRALRSYGRSKIIEKWLLLEDSDQDIYSQEFDAKKKIKLSQMQSILKNGYFRNTPLEFLLVLSYVDNSEMMNPDFSRFSYVYDCLIREKINNISNKDTKTALAYSTLLEILAYELYLSDVETLFDEKCIFKAIADYNENYPSMKGTAVKIVQRLIQFRILEEKNDKYKFKYNYMYYYFAGSHIVKNLSPEEREAITKQIFSNLLLETNYNIALFMAYSMNAQHDILPKVKNICTSLLTEHKDFKYEDQQEFLKKINFDIVEKLNEIYKIPENSEIPEIQKKIQIQNDDFAESQEINLEKEDRKLLFTANFWARQKERVDSDCLPAFLFD